MRAVYRIAIVGAGPRFLYAFERFAAIFSKLHLQGKLTSPIEIHVYDPSGQFGPGCHNINQPSSNWLNLPARYITRTPDETVNAANLAEYPSIIAPQFFYEFIQHDLKEPQFDPDDYPERAKLGLFFQKAVSDIQYELQKRSVPVKLIKHAALVIDLVTINDRTYVIYQDKQNDEEQMEADYILLVTGHPREAALTEIDKKYLAYAGTARNAHHNVHYMPPSLDVEKTMSLENVPPGSSVGLWGESLDTVDKILQLTEGRGGVFIRDSNDYLHYQPSNFKLEPQQIITFSESNMFASAKGRNEMGHLQYQPKFFTLERIKILRQERLQQTGSAKLDFDLDVFPLIYMDMAYEFYRVRQSNEADQYLPFDLRALVDPFYNRPEVYHSIAAYQKAQRELLITDIQYAKTGNKTNPIKAATKALNDMVSNLRILVDRDGLTARSEKIFRDVFDRYIFKKLATSILVKSKEKLLALQELGLLNTSVGPNATVSHAKDGSGFIIQSEKFKKLHYHVENLAIAHIPGVSNTMLATDLPLPFKYMMGRGDIRFHVNEDINNGLVTDSYCLGTIDVDKNMHPISAKETINKKIYLLGVAVEGAYWCSNSLGQINLQSITLSQAAQVAFDIARQLMSQSCVLEKSP